MENINNLTIKQVTNIVNEMKQIMKHPDYAIDGFQQKASADIKFEDPKSLKSKYVNLANNYDLSIEELNTIWNKYGNVL
jgi:hypothetical protein